METIFWGFKILRICRRKIVKLGSKVAEVARFFILSSSLLFECFKSTFKFLNKSRLRCAAIFCSSGQSMNYKMMKLTLTGSWDDDESIDVKLAWIEVTNGRRVNFLCVHLRISRQLSIRLRHLRIRLRHLRQLKRTTQSNLQDPIRCFRQRRFLCSSVIRSSNIRKRGSHKNLKRQTKCNTRGSLLVKEHNFADLPKILRRSSGWITFSTGQSGVFMCVECCAKWCNAQTTVTWLTSFLLRPAVLSRETPAFFSKEFGRRNRPYA